MFALHLDEKFLTDDDLSDAAHEGTLTYPMLWQAICNERPQGGECMPEYYGIEWITRHSELFRKAVGNVTFFLVSTAQRIFEARLSPHDRVESRLEAGLVCFVQYVLCRPKLLDLLEGFGAYTLPRLFLTLTDAFPPWDLNRWVDAAEHLGIPPRMIGARIVARLRKEAYEPHSSGIFSGFLDYGFTLDRSNPLADSLRRVGCPGIEIARVGREMRETAPGLEGLGSALIRGASEDALEPPNGYALAKDSVWLRMPKELVREGLDVCSRSCPEKILATTVWYAMHTLFGPEAARAILRAAVRHLQTIGHASLEAIALSDRSDRAALAVRLLGKTAPLRDWEAEETMRFVFDNAEFGTKERFLACLEAFLKREVDVSVVYRHVYRRYGVGSRQELCARELLFSQGWSCGVVSSENHKERRQYIVRLGRDKYVLDSRTHRYNESDARSGDHVIFDGRRARELRRGVYLVNFVALHDRQT